ncbi:MAG: hypothetical protein WCR45_10840 [Bacteroidaceae bacterium]|nr:hypothetical protein [Bacteroidaceae bacterium]
MDTIINWTDHLLFICFSLYTFYLFILALLSHAGRKRQYPPIEKKQSFAIIIPTQTSFPAQEYPEDLYKVFNCDDFRELVPTLDEKTFDITLILSGTDNIQKNLLKSINKACISNSIAIQLQTQIKNFSTFKLKCQALREEINNSLYIKGYSQIGFSATFTGHDIALNTKWLKKNLKSNHTNLERMLLRQGIYVDAIDNEPIGKPLPQKPLYKTNRKKAFSLLGYAFGSNGSIDYRTKMIHCILPTPYFSAIAIAVCTTLVTVYNWREAISWWILLFGILLTLSLAIPDYLVKDKKITFKKIIHHEHQSEREN